MRDRLSFLVAGGIVAVLVIGLAGLITLAALNVPIPGVLENLLAAALGALGALLARVGGDTVRIDQPANDPIPVTDREGAA